jgi:hypothetical protein
MIGGSPCSRCLPGKNRLSSDTAIRNVLIYRLGSLGDTVVALPCLHLVARTYPNAQRVLLTNFPVNSKAPAAAAVLGGTGLVHGYMRYTVGTRRVGELLRLAWLIRRFSPRSACLPDAAARLEQCPPRPHLLPARRSAPHRGPAEPSRR